jgi:hypothetical protein
MQVVPSADLVPGDVVEVAVGGKVRAWRQQGNGSGQQAQHNFTATNSCQVCTGRGPRAEPGW